MLATGDSSEARFTFNVEGPTPRILGAADASGDGRPEAFVVVKQGASTVNVGLFRLQRGTLRRVVVSGKGTEARDGFQLGGGTTHGDGIECRDVDGDGRDELVTLHVRGFDPEQPLGWNEEIYRWRDDGLAFWRQGESGTISMRGDARLKRFYQLRCGALSVSV